MKKEPDWARWRAWLIAASATTIPSGATAACGAWETSCAAYGDFSSDAAVDTSTRADAVVSGSACAPGDVSAFVPMWKPPTDFHQGLCTDVQTAAFVDCLSNVPDAPTCKTFEADPANKACVACAATPSTAAKYGPLVEDTVTIAVNVPGCISQASGDVSGTSCGAAVLALSQCEQFACEEADCPGGGDGPNLPGILACEKAAGNTVCKSYADAAACADALEADGGVAAACVDAGTTFAENAKAMVKLFCGGIFGDAGASDAGDGG